MAVAERVPAAKRIVMFATVVGSARKQIGTTNTGPKPLAFELCYRAFFPVFDRYGRVGYKQLGRVHGNIQVL